jgi:hypothetical protein
MSNKTISINPSLFSLSGSKTKKNREKKTKEIVPIISPNVLKNKLLKRIKEHKQRETQYLDNNKRKLTPKTEDIKPVKNNEILNFSDEFNDSINYLQTLSKQKRINDEKKIYEIQKQKQKEELERRTIRNYHSIGGENIQNPIINIDLPDELMHQVVQAPIISEPFKINTPYQNDRIPYSNLKGGLKPSYREWTRTQRNNIVTNPNASLVIPEHNFLAEKTAREKRLNSLKEKIKQKELESKVDPMLNENLIKKPENQLLLPMQVVTQIQPQIQPQNSGSINQTAGEQIVATKHITKKTIKRKYTLGRSDMKRKVAVLIKDRGTRKKILTAQKELKRKNINDIKEYLRDHNLVKIGSSAPNDVLRKMYESAMLAGEITNSNSDILLNNFSKEDKAL